MTHTQQRRRTCGFTLMETLLAIALVSLLVSIFLTVFVPSRSIIQQAITKQESDRLVSVLRAELNTIRRNERSNSNQSSPTQYRTTFDKGFYWLLKSRTPDKSIVIFSYRADTSKPLNADDTYQAVPPNTVKPGSDTVITTVACPMDSIIHKKNIPYAVGPVFLVKLTQIEQDGNGSFKLASSPGSISNGSSPETYYSTNNTDVPWGGAIFCRADFYLMYPPNPARYVGRPWSRVGRPVFSSNFSFRR